jgi:hypothetical protein
MSGQRIEVSSNTRAVLKSSWTHNISSRNFVEMPSLSRDTLLTTLHPVLENVLQTVDHFEIFLPRSSLFMVGKAQKLHGARYELNYVWVGKSGSVEPHKNIRHTVQISPPCDFWDFPTMKRECRGKTFRSDQRSAARFREVGGAL